MLMPMPMPMLHITHMKVVKSHEVYTIHPIHISYPHKKYIINHHNCSENMESMGFLAVFGFKLDSNLLMDDDNVEDDEREYDAETLQQSLLSLPLSSSLLSDLSI